MGVEPMSKSVVAEVLAIGDELASGQRLDTNSRWLSQQLGELGIGVAWHTTVGDDLARLVDVLRTAWRRADVVILSGGLGPTADDLTRQALAEASGRPLVLDSETLQHIQTLFARRGRTMPDRNKVQAEFPAGSTAIRNPHGTAPGIYLQVARPARPAVQVIALPGVPAELRGMWSASVVPSLRACYGPQRTYIRHRSLRCFGAGESEIEALLPDLIRRGRRPAVGITASQATITLRITSEGLSPEQCEAEMAPTVATIQQCLGPLIFGEGDDEIQDAVIRLLRHRGASVATAECGTGGLLATWLHEAARGSQAYRGGVVAENLRIGRGALQLDRFASHQVDKGQAGLVQAMAMAARNDFQATYALAVGPFPDVHQAASTDLAVQRVALAWADRRGAHVQETPFSAHPAIVRARTAKQALNYLRLALLNG